MYSNSKKHVYFHLATGQPPGDILPFSRMIWLVRFLRVLSMIPSLRELTLGIMDALHGLFWVPCRKHKTAHMADRKLMGGQIRLPDDHGQK